MQYLVSFDLGKSHAEYCNSPFKQELGDIVIVGTIIGFRLGRVIEKRPHLDTNGKPLPVINNNTVLITLDPNALAQTGELTSIARESNVVEEVSVAAELNAHNQKFNDLIDQVGSNRVEFNLKK